MSKTCFFTIFRFLSGIYYKCTIFTLTKLHFFITKIDNLNSEYEREKQKMKNDFENEKQKLIKAHEKAFDDTQNQFHMQILEINQASKSKIENLTSVSLIFWMKKNTNMLFK